MEGGKTFVKIIALDGDPETDDASLHGVYRSDEGDTAEKRVALTHDEWTRVREGEMPFALEIESERVETIARSRPKRVGDVASTGVPGTTAC